jgi:hypothetical protein
MEKTTRNLCQDNWPESQNLNEGNPEERGELLAQ